MSAAELTSADIAQLSDLAEPASLGILLGAGASTSAGLPSWDQFAISLLVKSKAVPDEETAQLFLNGQDPVLAAEAARVAAADRWPIILREALYPDSGGPPVPTMLHLAVANVAATSRPNQVKLFTLNFDLLLEGALETALKEQGVNSTVYSRATSSPRASDEAYEVNHLHGLIPPVEDPTNVVLGLTEFSELTNRRHPWQVAALHECVQRGPLVLVGTSYRDPDIRQWLHDLYSEDDGRLYGTSIILARQGMGFSHAQFDKARSALMSQWDAVKVRAVLVHDYADTTQVFRELPFFIEDGYQSPAERATALWDKHVAAFTFLQNEHSAALESDVEALRPYLGSEANLTLWLSDGAGQLVRWATNDRIYRNWSNLRRIRPGWDSPWIAGVCVSRDDVYMRDLNPEGNETRRWRSVVSVPIVVERPGGPAFTVGALTSATPRKLQETAVADWVGTLEARAEGWSVKLSNL